MNIPKCQQRGWMKSMAFCVGKPPQLHSWFGSAPCFFKRIAAPDWILKGQSSASFKAQMLPIFATFKVNSKESLR